MRIYTGSFIIALLLPVFILLSGCQSGQLNDCQQENIKLSAEINQLKVTNTKQKTQIQQTRQSVNEYAQLVVDMTALLESAKADVERLRSEVAELKKP